METCALCDGSCSPNEGIINNMRYFSALTQHTLSAFHRPGVDTFLVDEIENVRKALAVSKFKVLVDIRKGINASAERSFTDGTTDTVAWSNRFKKVLSDNNKNVIFNEDIASCVRQWRVHLCAYRN